MKQQDFTCSIAVNITPQQAIDAISSVPEWWCTNFEGSSQNVGDIFTVRFGDTFKTLQITERIPGLRVVWKVIDCHMPWLADKTEWNGTSVEWAVSRNGDSTRVSLTHIGLVPEIECYNQCRKGWTFYATESLLKLMSDGKGLPH